MESTKQVEGIGYRNFDWGQFRNYCRLWGDLPSMWRRYQPDCQPAAWWACCPCTGCGRSCRASSESSAGQCSNLTFISYFQNFLNLRWDLTENHQALVDIVRLLQCFSFTLSFLCHLTASKVHKVDLPVTGDVNTLNCENVTKTWLILSQDIIKMSLLYDQCCWVYVNNQNDDIKVRMSHVVLLVGSLLLAMDVYGENGVAPGAVFVHIVRTNCAVFQTLLQNIW